MRTKKKPRKYIEPDAFHLARRKAGLTVNQAAIELDVNERTIRNYENGVVRIPYSSFRLIRLLAGYSLLGNNWEGWGFHQNKLWTPEGRSFEAHELRYIATYISIARHSIKTLKASSANGAAKPLEAVNSPLAIGEPSSATALFGVEVRQVKPQGFEIPLSWQEKAA
ncbi:MAG: VC1465 family Xer recombination activation factor [Methylotenera sp.]|uniref:VC1465 family Xer recombination activation factor n=1 Tax=Methylotenera sp. TaxID=2051956 RepID=UPI00271894F5|nr:VC1465 family Xer recombination activation factor [Methylotenera sp.]MDO9394602.1 VC1465 family Xer recombination activation factor [Methylotenera sp.]MDP1522848.1 VC1465 family Xer recombination activation factor [Methylotenera sp.]